MELYFAITPSLDEVGYLLSGRTQEGGPRNWKDVAWLIKVDQQGNKIWSKTSTGVSFANLRPASDGGYPLAGGGSLIKIDEDGLMRPETVAEQ